MKKTVFMVCATLVVSAAAIVGAKAYNYYSMPELMRANLEALSQNDVIGYIMCYDSYDTPSWWVDDYYARVCQDPNGNICVMYEGHNFSNEKNICRIN